MPHSSKPSHRSMRIASGMNYNSRGPGPEAPAAGGLLLLRLKRGLGGGEAGDGDAVGGAADVVEAELFDEGD